MGKPRVRRRSELEKLGGNSDPKLGSEMIRRSRRFRNN